MGRDLCAHGCCRLDRVAGTLSPQSQLGHRRLLDPAAAQCAVGAAVLRPEEYRLGVIRDRGFVGGGGLDLARICPGKIRGRIADRTVPGLDDGLRRHGIVSVEVKSVTEAAARQFGNPTQGLPAIQLLSNGSYTVMLTAAGSGYSRWRDLGLTRWREDPTLDAWGSYLFLRDCDSGEVWSAAFQPSGRVPDNYNVSFFEDRALFERRDASLRTALEVTVSGEDDAERRLVSVTNEGSSTREIELTTYSEVVLSAPGADTAHPAFSKMYVQTEFSEGNGALLATRRPRDPGPQYWMVHFCVLEQDAGASPWRGPLQFETDRARFLGRGCTLRQAAAIRESHALSGTVGTVLDPVLALRRRVRIEPGATVRAAFWTGTADGRTQALALVDKLRIDTAFKRLKTRPAGIGSDDAHLFQDIAGTVLYSNASLRAPR